MIDAPSAAGAQNAGNQRAQFILDVSAKCIQDPDDPALRQVSASILRAQTSIRMGNIVMEYDSDAAGGQENILSGALKGVVGKEYTFKLNEADEIVELVGLEELPKEANFMQVRFGPEQIKQLMLPALRLGLPVEGASLDSRWGNATELTLGPVGNVKADYEYHYAGDEQGLAQVDYLANLAIDMQAGGGANDPKVAVELKDGSIEGFMKIDKELRFPRLGQATVKAELTTAHPVDPTQKLVLDVKMQMGYELLKVEAIP